MKPTQENLAILKKLGFTCDEIKTKNPLDKEWYSLDNGWGFRLDAVSSFKQLFKNALKFNAKEDDLYS